MQEGKSRALAPSRERSERFVFQGRLGAGSTGSVYRAYDKARQATLAVKVLNEVEPSSLYRFKGEFRALTGIAHPNLVQLYDLLTLDGDWLLTMELVEGCNFLRYVRPLPTTTGDAARASEIDEATLTVLPDRSAARWQEALAANTSGWKAARKASPQSASSEPEGDGAHGPLSLAAAAPVSLAAIPLDEERLRSALRQLCEGIRALHRANRLHRDLKPANVLVRDHDGRLVICDFGLVTDGTAVAAANQQGDGVGIAGTLSYMSPEQATGQPLTEASDWYAVGVMLYQALTGSQPYLGCPSVSELIAAKQAGKVVHPCSIATEAPEDLAALAVALLAGAPNERPGYDEIVRRIDSARRSPSLGPSAPQRLIGRDAQLAQLRAALVRARAGSATVAMIGGRSGMGKSSLVQHFLAEVREREHAVVLSGRCYEHEELPYKTFDPLLDALSAHLMQLEHETVRELLPPHVASLARLFPVLRRVSAVAEATRGEPLNPLEEKRRAFVALRELCRRISLRRPLVLYIDDLQWGDLDSGMLFQELLHPPQAPALLMICAYRSEDEQVSPLLQALRKTHFPESDTVPLDVRVEALSHEDSKSLAQTVLNGQEAAAERVAAEAGGSPFFVCELALYLRAHGGLTQGQLRLENLIADRLARLPGPARALFAVIAVAGRPERCALVQAAAKLGEQGMNALRILEAQHLVHCTGPGLQDLVQVYHDRLRETACLLLQQSEQRQLHRALAEALEKSPERDAEALFEHWRECGERHKAGAFAREAAEKAEGLFAFERAAKLYRAALDFLPLAGEEARSLEERLGHALMLSGRAVEAAEAFSRALAGASPAQTMQLRSLATTQLLRAGRIDRAFDELKRAKALIGLAVPTTNLRALLMWAWRRFKIRFKRLRLRRNQPIAKELLERADMLWGVGSSLACVDTLRGAVYQAEHLLVAVRSNDPYRMACALAVEAAISATHNRDPGRTQYLIDRGLELAGMSGEPHALSVVKGTAAICRYLEGHFRDAARLAREAQEVLRERLNATLTWDLVSMVIFDLMSTALLGNVRELVERVPEALRDAEARGDLYAATACRTTRFAWAWLGPDHPELARRQVELAESQWRQTGYQLQHWYMTFAHAEIDLYSDTPGASLERVESEWRQLVFIRTMQCTRIETSNLRARLRLACACKNAAESPGAVAAQLASVRRDAKAILAENTAWGFALGRLLLAGVASFEDVDAARTLLRELEGQCDALDMQLHQQVARYRRGQLTAGEEGQLLCERAAAAMRALGVEQPAGFVRMLAPGFPSCS